MKNIIADNPEYFKLSESRMHWCKRHHFLPVYNYACQPQAKGIVYPDTQYFMVACWNDEAKARLDAGEEVTRKADNLMPTGFVYESDNLTLKEQLENIKGEAIPHILTITHSGNKSFHIIVPIHLTDSYAIGSNRELYKYLWKQVAKRLFNNIDALDAQCASIGRLSRMPGALRLKSIANGFYLDTKNTEGCKEQKCVYYNDEARPIDLRNMIEAYELKAMGVQISNALRTQRYKRQSVNLGDDELGHLQRSQAKFPTPCKETALMVLEDDNIPSSDLLPDGGSYISTIYYLRNRFPSLLEEFVRKVKQAHPTCLPKAVNEYL